MLKDNLYSILRHEGDTFRVALNGQCFIYAAHFPGQPITPGVCTIQMARELVEEYTALRLRLTDVKNVKFLTPLSPTLFPEALFRLAKVGREGDRLTAQVSVSAGDVSIAKISFACEVVA